MKLGGQSKLRPADFYQTQLFTELIPLCQCGYSLLLTVTLRGMEKQLSLAAKRRQVLQNASHIT